MKYKNGIIEYGDQKLKLNFAEEHPFLENVRTKKKTYVHMLDMSHFWWDKNGIHWTLRIDRKSVVKSPSVDYMGKETIDYECDCYISSEKIDLEN